VRIKAARAKLPGRIGKLLGAAAPAVYGNSSEAVTKHVTRLVRERDKRQRTQEEGMQLWFGRSPPLMSSLIGFSMSNATVAVPADAADGMLVEGQKSTRI
jgi:hypothetical protein